MLSRGKAQSLVANRRGEKHHLTTHHSADNGSRPHLEQDNLITHISCFLFKPEPLSGPLEDQEVSQVLLFFPPRVGTVNTFSLLCLFEDKWPSQAC